MKEDQSILEGAFYLLQLSKDKASKVASRTWKRSGRKQEIPVFTADGRIYSLFSVIVMPLSMKFNRRFVQWSIAG